MDFLNLSLLLIFIPTFILVSITPGMCMTLALSMGLSIGLKKTFYMMYGELLGVGLIASLSAVGVAAIVLKYPFIFLLLKYGGGTYLVYLGVMMWLSRGKISLNINQNNFNVTNKTLVLQGFLTAITNPKGWAFFISLLPPFLDQSLLLAPQLTVLIFVILILEFISLVIYASSGSMARKFLQNNSNIKLLNKIAGSMMIGIGIWLATG